MAATTLPVISKLFRIDFFARKFTALKDWVIEQGFLFRLRWLSEASAYLGTFYVIAFGFSLEARHPLFADLVLVFGALLSVPCMVLTLKFNTTLLDTAPRPGEKVRDVLLRLKAQLIGLWMIAFLLPLSLATKSSGLGLILFVVGFIEVALFKDQAFLFANEAANKHPRFFCFTVLLFFSAMVKRDDSLVSFFSISMSLPVHAAWHVILTLSSESELRKSVLLLLFVDGFLSLCFGMCGHLQSLLISSYCTGAFQLLKGVYKSSVSVGIFVTATLILTTSLLLTYTALPSYLCLRFF